LRQGAEGGDEVTVRDGGARRRLTGDGHLAQQRHHLVADGVEKFNVWVGIGGFHQAAPFGLRGLNRERRERDERREKQQESPQMARMSGCGLGALR
jgi:hypothetical protein